MHVSRVATHSTLAGERGCGYSRVVARNHFYIYLWGQSSCPGHALFILYRSACTSFVDIRVRSRTHALMNSTSSFKLNLQFYVPHYFNTQFMWPLHGVEMGMFVCTYILPFFMSLHMYIHACMYIESPIKCFSVPGHQLALSCPVLQLNLKGV